MKSNSQMLTKLGKMIEDIKNKMSEKEWDSYVNTHFPVDNKKKGWINIDDCLPKMLAQDVERGYSIFTVKNEEGIQFESNVSDHYLWYHTAKQQGITHWLNK